MDAWVYMLRCGDGAHYVGSHRGPDCADRAASHNAGVDRKAYTYRRRPVELVWCERFDLALDAISVERQLKGWSRAKKTALILGDWSTIKALARSRPPRPSTSSG